MNVKQADAIRAQLLGQFTMTSADGREIRLVGQKPTGILAYLMYHIGQDIPRERIIDLFWSDRGPKQGQDSLRQAILAIRSAFGPLAEQAFRIDRRTMCALEEAVQTDLWQGDGAVSLKHTDALLEGMNAISPVFDEWLLSTRRQFTNQQISAAEQKLGALDIRTDADTALEYTTTILALDPMNEPVARIEMEIYASQGRMGHAGRTLETLCAHLRAHDLEPSDETLNYLKKPNLGTLLIDEPAPTNPAAPMWGEDRGVPSIDVVFAGGPDADGPLMEEFEDRLVSRMTQMPEIWCRMGEADDTVPQYQLDVSSGQTGKGLRISLRLSAPDKRLIWSDRAQFPIGADDAHIATAVDRLVTQMLPTLEEHIFHSIDGAPTTAYGNYLYAKRIFATAQSEDYIEQALRYLQHAMDVDPEFLPTHAYLVMLYNTGFFMSRPGSRHDDQRTKAFQIAQKMLFLNSRHANSHICMAWCLMWRGQFDAAERSLRRAMDLSPYEPHRLNIVGTALVYLGHHDEGATYYEMAQDRIHHDFDFQRTDFGELFFFKRDFRQAVSWMEAPEARTPYKTLFFRALAHAQLGEMEQAQRDVTSFAEDVGKRWQGAKPFRTEAAFQWYCDLLPLRLPTDRQTLRESMKLLGISVQIPDPA